MGLDKTLMIIDDEPEIREILESIFHDDFKTIYQAKDGKEGLEIIRTQKPSVIISDFHMPKLNGLELLRFLQDEGIKTPVVWLTGHASRELFCDAWGSGVYDIFEKPFDSVMLRDSVIAAIDWGTIFNATRVPGFIARIKLQEIKLSIDKKNYEELIKRCETRGISVTSMLNHLIQKELKEPL